MVTIFSQHTRTSTKNSHETTYLRIKSHSTNIIRNKTRSKRIRLNWLILCLRFDKIIRVGLINFENKPLSALVSKLIDVIRLSNG